MTKEKRQEYIDVLQECLDGKWKDPVYPRGMYSAIECAACEEYREIGCSVCPIGMAVGSESCQSTPGSRDEDAIFNEAIVSYESILSKMEWNKMVEDEQLFLRALTTHIEDGHELETFKEMTDYDWRKDAL